MNEHQKGGLSVKGYLITNAFWHSASMDTMGALLCAAAQQQGVLLERHTNGEDYTKKPDADFILFWDKDVRLAWHLEKLGCRLFNAARAIALCDDKTLTWLALQGKNIPMPTTRLCPLTFPGNGYPNPDFLDDIGQALGYPMIIKEGCGSFGQQVYLAHNQAEALQILDNQAGKPLLCQEWIRESAGKDLRLYMVGDTCAAAMRRVNRHDFRANIQSGGSAELYQPTQEEIELAQKACHALGLTFAGVDLLQSNRGPLLCEVNSNAHFIALENLTHADVAGQIIRQVKHLCLDT